MTSIPSLRCRASASVLRWLMTACLLGVPVTPGIAADLVADAHVDHVTVYRQGAVVTRVAEVSVPAGSHRLIFRGLPANVDARTLQVTASGAGMQLGDIEVVRINEANFVSEPERELRRRIEEVGDQQAVLTDEVAVAQDQLKLLDSLASNPAGSPNKAVVDASNLTAVLATMATGESAARKRVREANLQLRTVARQKEQLEADLAKVATKSKQSTEVRAAVLADTAATADVAVSYTNANFGAGNSFNKHANVLISSGFKIRAQGDGPRAVSIEHANAL